AGEERGEPPLVARTIQQQVEPAAVRAKRSRLTHILRSVAAAALHRHLEMRGAEQKIVLTGVQQQVGRIAAAPERLKETHWRVRLQSGFDLLREAGRVSRRLERFPGQ